MDDDRMDEGRLDPEVTEMLRGRYNAPPPTPREEMWGAIQAGLTPRDAPVLSLDEARARRRPPDGWRVAAWAGAAAAVLILGIGIGRMSAPTPARVGPIAGTQATLAGVLHAAAMDHLGRTEALLTLVRADARDGRVDPAMQEWARGLLGQTRLLLDSSGADDPAMKDLLEDLELVLVQIVRVTEVKAGDPSLARSEMNLALQGLDERDILPRIQAVLPAGPGLAGT